MCSSARQLTDVFVNRFRPKSTDCIYLRRFQFVPLLLVLLGAMIGCGGSGSGSSTTTPPPPPSLTITSISNISPLPLTPVQISTSGLNVNSAVMDVLQLSGLLAGDVKESRDDNPTRDLQMAADRTRSHTLCGPVVSSLFSVSARC